MNFSRASSGLDGAKHIRITQFMLPLLLLVVTLCACSTPATDTPNPNAPTDECYGRTSSDSKREITSMFWADMVTNANGYVVPHGRAHAENLDGAVLIRGNFKSGLRDGHWTYYSPDGAIETSEEWDDSRLIRFSGVPQRTYGGFGFAGDGHLYSPTDSVAQETGIRELWVVFQPYLTRDEQAKAAIKSVGTVLSRPERVDALLEDIQIEDPSDTQAGFKIRDAINHEFGNVVANVLVNPN